MTSAVLALKKLKRAATRRWRDHRLDQALAEILQLPPGGIPSRTQLERLRDAWANQGYSANLAYLEEVCRQAATTRGPVLECGSGLTTLVLGALASRRGVQVVSLEHIEVWQELVSLSLKRNRMESQVLFSPLVDYGEYDWYGGIDTLPDGISLVICDGPPGITRGGRYGLVAVKGKLHGDVVILLDDADRPGEAASLRRWESELGLFTNLVERSEGTYAQLGRAVKHPGR